MRSISSGAAVASEQNAWQTSCNHVPRHDWRHAMPTLKFMTMLHELTSLDAPIKVCIVLLSVQTAFFAILRVDTK